MTAVSQKPRLFAILALAFVLRAAGLGYGLPFVYHQDEPIVVNHAMAVGADGWNTRVYFPPQFASYFLFLIYGVFFLLGKLLGFFPTIEHYAIQFLKDPTLFYLLGRFFLGVLPGTAAVWAVWRLASHFVSRSAGLLAAFFLSINFLHVQHSHYLYVDVFLSLALLLFFHALLAHAAGPSFKTGAGTGLFYGFAVAVKYTAVYFFPVLLIGFLLARTGWFNKIKYLLVCGAATLTVYAMISPFTFLDWTEFIRQVRDQSGARRGVDFFHHFGYSLAGSMGYLTLFLAVPGFIGIWRKSKLTAGIFAVACLTYYAVNVIFTQTFPRYMMPLVPLLCVFAAMGLEMIVGFIKQRILKAVFVVLVILESLVPSVYSDILLMTKDTRTLCLEWFHSNVAEGSTVVVANRFFAPAVNQTIQQVREKSGYLNASQKDSARGKRLNLMEKALSGKKTYKVYTLSNVDDSDPTLFLFERPFVKTTWKDIRRIGAQYFVFNYSEFNPEKTHFLETAGSNLELAASFSPYWDPFNKQWADKHASTAAPHLRSDLFSRRRLGPALEVYRVKGESPA